MEQTAHIFTPVNNSLHERVRAYQKVLSDMHEFNQRTKAAHYSDDWLGDKQDIAYAYQILQNSMSVAYSNLSDRDITQAQKEGLLSHTEVTAFIRSKREQEIQTRRDQSKQSLENYSSSFNRKV